MFHLKPKQIISNILSNNGQLVLFGLVHLAIIIFWVNFTQYNPRYHPDVELYFEYAGFMLAGDLPYRDFAAEYPPLSLLFMLLPRLLSSSIEGYANGFTGLILVFNIAGLAFVSLLSRKLGLHHTKTLVIYTLTFFALGDIAINRFDVIPAILTLGAIYFYINGNNKMSWFFLGLGALTKLYPLILAPLFALYYLYKRQYRILFKGLAVFSLTGLTLVVPSIIISFSGFWAFIDFHSVRSLQLESSYSSILIVAEKLGIGNIEVISGKASLDISGSGVGFLISASTYLTLAALIIVYWFYYRNLKIRGYSHSLFINFSLGAIAMLIVTSKVLSPQFVIWLYPLICLLNNRLAHIGWVVFVAIGLLSIYIFPNNYGQLVNLEQPAVIFLLVRNILIFGLGVSVFVTGVRDNASQYCVQK